MARGSVSFSTTLLRTTGIARRIEQTAGNLLSVNYGTLYPALLKLEQEGYIASEWGCDPQEFDVVVKSAM